MDSAPTLSVDSSVAEEVIVRELELRDYYKGFCETLNELSPCELTYQEYHYLWYRMVHFQHGWRQIVVAEKEGRIIGTATLLLERKFIHNGGVAGRIEDVAVLRDYRKQGVGKMLIEHLLGMAKSAGCYKITLACASWNTAFYEKSGFQENGVSMRIDLPAR